MFNNFFDFLNYICNIVNKGFLILNDDINFSGPDHHSDGGRSGPVRYCLVQTLEEDTDGWRLKPSIPSHDCPDESPEQTVHKNDDLHPLAHHRHLRSFHGFDPYILNS